MLDERGGRKALDTALIRDALHAATMVGRVAAAHRAIKMGLAIEPDPGPSGKLGHWRVAGIPQAACDLFSKRATEIDRAIADAGYDTYQARQVAARETRKAKRHTPVDELMPRWRAELEAAGLSVEDLARGVLDAADRRDVVRAITAQGIDELARNALAPGGRLAAQKVFTLQDAVVAVAPAFYGQRPAAARPCRRCGDTAPRRDPAPRRAGRTGSRVVACVRRRCRVGHRSHARRGTRPDVTRELRGWQWTLHRAEELRTDIERGRGGELYTPEGRAGLRVTDTRQRLDRAEHDATNRDLPRSSRRHARDAVAGLRPAVAAATADFDRIAGPRLASAASSATEARTRIAALTEAAEFLRAWLVAHPEALPRLERIEHELAALRPPPAVEPAVVALERHIGRSIGRSVGGPELGL